MLRVTGDMILIQPDEVKGMKMTRDGYVTEGGIAIPSEAMKRDVRETSCGTIVGIGDWAWKDVCDGNPWAKLGDRVYYPKYAGKTIEDPDTDEIFVIIKCEDVLCIVKDKDKGQSKGKDK